MNPRLPVDPTLQKVGPGWYLIRYRPVTEHVNLSQNNEYFCSKRRLSVFFWSKRKRKEWTTGFLDLRAVIGHFVSSCFSLFCPEVWASSAVKRDRRAGQCACNVSAENFRSELHFQTFAPRRFCWFRKVLRRTLCFGRLCAADISLRFQ